jgi:hypothetical protein
MLRQIWVHPLTKNKNMFNRRHVPAMLNLVWFADELSTALY